MCAGSRTESSVAGTRFELWDLVTRNVIDWFTSEREAVLTVQAYVDADDAGNYMLIEYLDARGRDRVYIGSDLEVWLAAHHVTVRQLA